MVGLELANWLYPEHKEPSMKLIQKLLAGATLAAGLTASAFAAQVACTADMADNVQHAGDCEYSDSVNQDNTNDPLVVNQEAFFGFTDWDFIKKDEGTSAQGQSGTYDFGAALSLYDDLMLIFKDGGNTTLVGYTMFSQASGTWTTPFLNPPFDVNNPADVSHISYYGRIDANGNGGGGGNGNGGGMPEPGTLALAGIALLGAAVARRRQRR
jgi:hypothetical protein